MNESNDCRLEQSSKSLDKLGKLIEEQEQLTEKYVAKIEEFYRSMYEQASQAREAEEKAGFSIAKKCDLPKLADKDACERQVYQYLDRLKQLSLQLNSLSVSEQTLLFLDHLEVYKQKTIDFCRSTLKCPSASKPNDYSKEFAQIIELFQELKTKLDEQQDRQSIGGPGGLLQSVDSSRELCTSIHLIFDKHFKHSELDAIDFDELVEETTRCVQSETASKGEQDDKKASAKKEIDFKLNLIIEKARIGLKKFEDELGKNQNDELSDFAERTIKAVDGLEGSLRFDLQAVDYEDEQFAGFLTAVSSSMETFVSKVHYAISDSLEKSFHEQYELNEALIANLSKLAGTVLIKRLTQDRRYEVPKDLKVDMRKVDTHRKSESFKGNVLQKKLENLKRPRKERYSEESDLMFKTTDLIAVITKHKQAQNVPDEDAKDGLPKIKAGKSKKLNFPSMYQISVPSSRSGGRTDMSEEMREEQLSKLIASSKKSASLPSDKKASEHLDGAKKRPQKMLKPDKKVRKDGGKRNEKKGK